MIERLEQILSRYNEIREKLSTNEVIQDIKKTMADLCKKQDEPVFEIVSRHKLYSALNDTEESYLLFLLRVNRFLEIFKPYLELS